MTPPTAPPPRPLRSFEPLITAAQGFPALERLAAEAERSIWLSFRVFDPQTRLRETTGFGDTWLDLLRAKLREGVSVRVMLADFEPIVVPDLHEGTWRSVHALNGLSGDGDIEILPLRHEARVGRGLRLGFWIPTMLRLDKQRKEMNALSADERTEVFAHRPGLWRYLRMDGSGRIAWRLPRVPRLFPASLHQKIAVADHARAVLGGLDIDERRYDDHSHDRAAPDTWYDVSVAVDGPIATDIARHIAEIWNRNRLRMAALRREQVPKAPPAAPPMPAAASALDAPEVPASDARALQLQRTLSVMHRHAPFRFSPRTEVKEIEDAHLALIGNARESLYIETQFLRSGVIADALAAAAQRNPELSLILILPAAPEDVAFEDEIGLPERFGEHLQAECVGMVTAAFGGRAAILSPARKAPSDSSRRDRLHDAEIIYVHSKVAVADDDTAIVGSANLNGRSLRWDTEAALLCSDADAVRRLRRSLIEHWFDDSAWEDVFALKACGALWAALARRNAALPPPERRSFLVPYDATPARDAGMPLPGVPEELV